MPYPALLQIRKDCQVSIDLTTPFVCSAGQGPCTGPGTSLSTEDMVMPAARPLRLDPWEPSMLPTIEDIALMALNMRLEPKQASLHPLAVDAEMGAVFI